MSLRGRFRRLRVIVARAIGPKEPVSDSNNAPEPTYSDPIASNDIYTTPLTGRYSSLEMQILFSQRTRFSTWRQLWLWLAEAQKELGLSISDEAIDQMRANLTVGDDEFPVIAEEEKKRKHDVMACVYAFSIKAPAAAGILHWGATSCYVTDGADLIAIRKAFDMLLPKLARAIHQLRKFAVKHQDLPCLSYTHGQPAQPITVGKRACLWIESLLKDLRNMERARSDLEFRGAKGTTGTQASFLAIFEGDHDKVKRLDELVTRKAGFASAFKNTSQTYSRKVDVDVIYVLSSFGCSCEQFGGDIRHLAMFKEIDEPFGKDQIGSSAMPLKRNPIQCERLCSIGRFLKGRVGDAMNTFSAVWLERSLDDSAIRRLMIPEAFLSADACLRLLINITARLVVYPAMIRMRLQEELPFMAVETILMALVQKGISRQEAHEQFRVLAHQAAATVKHEGRPNDLIERIQKTAFFKPIWAQLPQLLNPASFTGRAGQQVREFTGEGGAVDQELQKYQTALKRPRAGGRG